MMGDLSPVMVMLTEDGENGHYVGDYRIDRKLGQGAMARVCLAWNELVEHFVALKTYEKNGLTDEQLEEIHREVEVLERLDNPHIVFMYEMIDIESAFHLVLEYCDGGNFGDILARRGRPLPEDEVRRFFGQLVIGVHHCHSHNIVHRDLKLENLFLRGRDLVIGDFGFSSRFGTKYYTRLGSPVYCAPEILESEAGYDRSVDIYAMGICLFGFLTGGMLPFQGKDLSTLYAKIMAGDYSFPSDFSDDAKNIISWMLNKDPTARPSVEELVKHPFLAPDGLFVLGRSMHQLFVGVILEKGITGDSLVSFDSAAVEETARLLQRDPVEVEESVQVSHSSKISCVYHLLVHKRKHEASAQ